MSSLPEITKNYKCPHCKEPINIRVPKWTKLVSCPSCYFTSKLIMGELKQFEQRKSFSFNATFLIPIGSTVVINDATYICAGAVKKKLSDHVHFPWTEYYLYAPGKPVTSLSEVEGNWIFLEAIPHMPVPKGTVVQYQLRKYAQYSYDKVEVLHFAGESPSIATSSSIYKEYIAPPHILSCEITNDSAQWFVGRHVSKDEIESGIPDILSIPRRSAQGAITPNPVSIPGNLLMFAFVGYLALLSFVALISYAMETQLGSTKIKPLESTPYYEVPAAEVDAFKDSLLMANPKMMLYQADSIAFIRFQKKQQEVREGKKVYYKTPSFTLESNWTALEIKLDADVSNTWVGAQGYLINQDTGEQIPFWKDVEYYAGETDGERWSEGSKRSHIIISSLDKGTYHILVSATKPNAKGPDLVVTWIKSPFLTSNFLLFFFIGLAVMLATYFLQKSYETKRWANSDFDEYY